LAGFRYLLVASQRENIPTGEVVAYKALGFFHERKGNPDSAVLYLKRSVALADSIKQPMMKIQALVELEKAYRTAGQAANAAALHEKTDAIRDSMFTVDKTNVIHGLEVRFDMERKALENDNLRQRLFIRQGWVVFLLLLFVSALALIWLLRQRSRLWKERYHSYAVLIDKYRAEMEAERSSDVSSAPESSTVPGPRPTARKTSRAAAQPSPIYTDLQHLFMTKAAYRDPDLSIEEVSKWLNVTPRQISSALREREDVTFSQFVNNFRIREARKIMEDPASESLKLEIIGQRVGIPNRTYFQRVFESIVGVPPGHYRRHIRRDESEKGPEDQS
jgi:AraC-like DNA-binding protein